MPSLLEYATEWSIARIKKEYSKQRTNFIHQIERLYEKTGDPTLKPYLKGRYKYPRQIKDIENLKGRKNWTEKATREDWAFRLSELQQLQARRLLSITGRKAIRKDTIKGLQDRGFKSINDSNFNRFTSFMNWAKDLGVLDEYESQVVAEAFDQWVSGGIVENETLLAYINQWQSDVESIDLFSD